MRRLLNPLFALLLALLLVGGQQAALAHMLGHAAGPGAVELAQQDDVDHGGALALSHVCTTCIAFAGADVAPPSAAIFLATAAGQAPVPDIAVPPAPTFCFRAAFRSRAPPSL